MVLSELEPVNICHGDASMFLHQVSTHKVSRIRCPRIRPPATGVLASCVFTTGVPHQGSPSGVPASGVPASGVPVSYVSHLVSPHQVFPQPAFSHGVDYQDGDTAETEYVMALLAGVDANVPTEVVEKLTRSLMQYSQILSMGEKH